MTLQLVKNEEPYAQGDNREQKIAAMDQHVKDGGYLGGVLYMIKQAKERASNQSLYGCFK